MLLRDCQLVLQTSASFLAFRTVELGGGRKDIPNRAQLRDSARSLREVPSLRSLAEAVLASPLFQTESSVLNDNQAEALRVSIASLRESSEALQRFLDEVLPAEPEAFFSLSLGAESRPSTDEFAEGIKEVFIALDRPVRMLGHEPLRIAMGAPGSVWLELFGSAAGLSVVGFIMRYALQWQKIQEARARANAEVARAEQERAKATQEEVKVQQEQAKVEQERARATQEQAKAARELVALKRELRRLELEEEALGLNEDHAMEDISVDAAEPHECVATLKKSSRMTANLMSRGLVVRLPVNANPELAESFPPEMLPKRLGVAPKQLASPSKPKLLGTGERGTRQKKD